MASRVSPQIIHIPHRTLPREFTAGGAFGGTAKALGTTAPTTQHLEIAMGMAGDDNIVSICPDTAADITVYVWLPPTTSWVLLGANSTQHTKTFEANALDGFNVPKGTAFFLKASAVVEDVYIDAVAHAANPD